jgi:hypothetical protein
VKGLNDEGVDMHCDTVKRGPSKIVFTIHRKFLCVENEISKQQKGGNQN